MQETGIPNICRAYIYKTPHPPDKIPAGIFPFLVGKKKKKKNNYDLE